MKKIVHIVVVCIGFVGFAQSDITFDKANKLYNQEQYQKAIEAYTSILEEAGQESASLYYNLANAYYKLSKVGPSIYYYEKALQKSPNDEDILNNLAFAENATIDSIDVIPEGFVSRVLRKITNTFTFEGWAYLSVICMVLFVLLFIAYYTARLSGRKRAFFISSWIIFVIGIFGIVFAFKQFNDLRDTQYAIIFATETVIKSEPNLRSEEIFELHEGTKVLVMETVNDWKKIKLADGKIGWIPKADLKEL